MSSAVSNPAEKDEKKDELPIANFKSKVYKGIVMFENEIEEIEKMETRDDDIWVCSFPRSGTTMTQEITYLVRTLDFDKARTTQLDDRFPFIDVLKPDFPYYRGLKYTNEKPSPRFIKSHFHYFLLPEQLRNGKGKIIYTIRNPKDSIVSLYKLLRWFRMFEEAEQPFEEFFEHFMSGEGMYAGPWWTHCREYWEHRNDANILFLKFEDTRKDISSTVRKIADFLGRDLTEENIAKIVDHCSLENMRKNDMVNLNYQRKLRSIDDSNGGFINQGKVGGWTENLTEEMCKRVDEMFKREFGDTDLTFECRL